MGLYTNLWLIDVRSLAYSSVREKIQSGWGVLLFKKKITKLMGFHTNL